MKLGKRGPWRVTSSRISYKNPWLHIESNNVVEPRGGKGVFEVVHFREGVGVLALDDKGNAYLAREFAFAVGETLLCAALGGIEKGEKPLAAAKRELREELGIKARKWKYLGLHHPISMNARVPMHLYLAQELSFGKQKLDDLEMIERVRVPFKHALRMVMNGKITQGSTQVLILKANELLRKRR